VAAPRFGDCDGMCGPAVPVLRQSRSMGDHSMQRRFKTTNPGAVSSIKSMLLWSSGLVLLSLLLLNSFAQAHLIKLRPFRATDTDRSGGDHICDIRRDSDHDGRPDRLGDFVSVTGTIIAEPSTYETGGWLFWIESGRCGILVYGEQESYELGDSVLVNGWLRYSNGNYFFPQTGLATLGDVAIENCGTRLIKGSCPHAPTDVLASDFCSHPESYGGRLIRIGWLEPGGKICQAGDDLFVRLYHATDSVNLYLDGDIDFEIDLARPRCFIVTGIVVRMKTPADFAPSPSWCIAPRSGNDVVAFDNHSQDAQVAWGELKVMFAP